MQFFLKFLINYTLILHPQWHMNRQVYSGTQSEGKSAAIASSRQQNETLVSHLPTSTGIVLPLHIQTFLNPHKLRQSLKSLKYLHDSC